MAVGAPRICQHHQSIKVPRGSMCPKCSVRRKATERERSRQHRADPTDAAHFYNSPRWRKLSRLHKTSNPLCVSCMADDKITPVQETDHIISIADGGDRWDVDNLQSLCKSCHSRKTILEIKARGKYGGDQ